MSNQKQFQGSLETMPLPTILQWLSDSKKTGALVIKIRDEEKRIFLKDGNIISASSNLEKDRFGIIIIKQGYVTQAQVDELLEEGRKTGKLLGKLCVEKGLMPEEDVLKILQEQTMAIIESLLHREEGTFEFHSDDMDMADLDQISLSIALQELFFGSAAVRKEWKRVYQTLGSLEAIPSPVDIQPGNIQSLSEFQQYVLSRCNGKARILDLCAGIDQKDFAICRALADLVEKKWIEIKDPEEELNEDYKERMWKIHIMIEQNRFLRAMHYLDEIAVMFPQRSDDLKPLKEKVRHLMREDMDRLLTDDNLILYHRNDFDQTKATGKTFGPREWFMLSRIDGKATLKELCLMTGRPKEESRRIVYALIDAGAVDIKGREAETRKRKIPDPPEKPSAPPPRSPVKTKPFSAAPPPRKEGSEPGQEKISLSVEELDQIYRKYLKLNHYQILEVTPESSQEDIRNGFVKLSRLYHPDMYDRTHMDSDVQERLEELFSMVNHAYRVVSNTRSREKYNHELWVDSRISGRKHYDADRKAPIIDEIIIKPKSRKKSSPASRSAKKSRVSDTRSKMKKVKSTTGEAAGEAKKTPSKTKQAEPERPAAAGTTAHSREKEYLEEARALFKDSKYKDAIPQLENVLKQNARNAEAYYMLSRCQQRLGGKNLDDALNNIKRALIINKEEPRFFCQIGRVEMARENYEKAEKYYKTALAWDAENREAKYLLEKLREIRQKGFFAKFKRKKK